MKGKLLLLLLLLSYTLSAQLTITPGAQFFMTDNTQLTLHNTSLVNNGTFTTGNSRTSITGNSSSSIGGSQPLQFFELEVNKTNASIGLQRSILVTQRILFSSGFLNLDRFDIALGANAHLDGERGTSRITGSSGGQVLFSTVLNAPAGANPGNLGAFITSPENLGTVIIKRGHQSQVNASGSGKSILRYYDIVPANNTALDATLRFNYFDEELNGIDENSLVFFKSDDAINWSNQDFTTRNPVDNFVEKTGIRSFSRWTITNANNALPVLFVAFNVKCEGKKTIITWKTAQEQNSSHFDIERSADGIRWEVPGSLPAAGNSNTERSYLFTDNHPGQNSYYRIAEYDLDGKMQYTNVLRSGCTITDGFSLWPNPVRDRIFINIVTSDGSPATIKVFDSKGALVKTQKTTVLPGSNKLLVDLGYLVNGVYTLSIEWNKGQMKKIAQVLKQ